MATSTTITNGVRSLQSLSVASGNTDLDAVDQIKIVGAANAAAAKILTITNASMGQATTLTIPDPGAATANLLADAGPGNIKAFQCFLGVIDNPPAASAGTWTITRVAQGDYVTRHTAAANSPILAWNLTAIVSAAALKGFSLTAVDVISKVTTLALTSATPTLCQVVFANGVDDAVTTPAVTGTLSVATSTHPYVDTVTVTTPVYQGALSMLVLEVAYVCQSTSGLDVMGVNLHFNATIA